MELSTAREVRPFNLTVYLWIMGILWTGAVLASLIWNWVDLQSRIVESVRIQSRAAIEKDLLYRRWNARSGRVYVLESDKTLPNTHLIVPDRDVVTENGARLTMVNPAYMTRMVHEIQKESSGIQGHITSLKPIRPDNAPDSWETAALKEFEKGSKEVSSVETINGEPVLRLMLPLVTEQSCLACHSVQGYELGSIRGGISVTVPMVPQWNLFKSQKVGLVVGHAALWAFGLLGLFIAHSRLVRGFRQVEESRKVAEEASRSKSEFLANMSHEIRTPINGVIGMTELALNTELTPEQREYLDAVRISADSLLGILNDVLDFSKIEAGKLELVEVDFTFRDTMADIMTTLAEPAHRKGLELAYHVASDLPDVLIGDPGRLRQILVNLVGNSIKFTEKGEVAVTVQCESKTSDQIQLRFSVSDTGIGIPSDKQDKIFQAFEQADGSTARKYGGTGLGLTITSRLVQMMGGRIWLESEVGKGTTFHFELFQGIQTALAATTTRQEETDLKGLRVLIVDDNATNRRILEDTLLHWGIKPLVTDSAQSALDAIKSAQESGNPFSLVLTDCMMPEMDGFDLAERMNQDPSLKTSTIIMLTSGGLRGEASRCIDLGITAYLIKPVRQKELFYTIHKALKEPSPRLEKPALITRHSIRESTQSLRILLAEDNVVNQKLALRMLEKMGHTVAIAGNGREAATLLESSSFDLVLMDVQMPEMDGFEATALIREREQTTGKHVLIIAMTAHAMKGDKERCLEAGMDGYLSKPINTHELFDTLEAVVQAKNVGDVSVLR